MASLVSTDGTAVQFCATLDASCRHANVCSRFLESWGHFCFSQLRLPMEYLLVFRGTRVALVHRQRRETERAGRERARENERERGFEWER